MNLTKLSPEARAVVEWQLDKCGSFKKALWLAIALADETNMRRLSLAFPNEVEGYRNFTRAPGWWDAVQRSLDES